MIDDDIQQLHDDGLSKVDIIQVIRSRYAITLFEAKVAVHDHPAFAERKDSDEEFHDRLTGMVE